MTYKEILANPDEVCKRDSQPGNENSYSYKAILRTEGGKDYSLKFENDGNASHISNPNPSEPRYPVNVDDYTTDDMSSTYNPRSVISIASKATGDEFCNKSCDNVVDDGDCSLETIKEITGNTMKDVYVRLCLNFVAHFYDWTQHH